MFDVIGYNWSHVWCDWKYIHAVITWETVQQCDRGISSSKTLLLEFFFALFLSSTSTSTTLTFNGFPLNRYGQLELTFCWTQLITGVLFALQACFLGFELAMKFFDWLAPNWWYDMERKREFKCPHCQLYSVIHTSILKLKMEIIFLLSPQATFLIYDKRERLKNLPVLSDDYF